MPPLKKADITRLISRFFLVLIFVRTLLLVWDYYRIKRDFASPLIPNSTVILMARPYLNECAITFGVLLVCLLLYYYKKYILLIIVGLLAVGWQLYFFYISRFQD
jgi:hypothetical protein